MGTTQRYTPRHEYTQDELVSAYLDDLRADRDQMLARMGEYGPDPDDILYVQQLEAEITALETADNVIIGSYGIPIPNPTRLQTAQVALSGNYMGQSIPCTERDAALFLTTLDVMRCHVFNEDILHAHLNGVNTQ